MTDNRQGWCNWLTWPPIRGFAAARALLAALLAVLAAGQLLAQEPSWKTGPAIRRELEIPLSLTWKDREVRDALTSLSKSTGVAVLLDRRIDPTRKLELQATDEPLRDVLLRVAEQVDGGVSLVGSVVYLGPQATASKLATLAALKRQQAGQLSADLKIKLAKNEAWSWAELSEPRQLLAELAQRGGVRVANAERIPHDLWPAANWPAIPWTERATLLLAGFELTYELAADGTLRLVPLPSELVFDKTYTPRGDVKTAAADLRRIVPEAKILVTGSKLAVSASVEDHDRIDKLLRGESVKTTRVNAGQKRYTLTVDGQPAGAVVKTLATQLGKEMSYDPALFEKLQTKVSFAVEKVPLEELLDKTLKPLGLTHRIGEGTLEIVAP